MLLVGFWCKEGFEKPLATVDLAGVAKLCEGCNALPHDRDLAGAIVDLFNADGLGGARVNYARIILDWDELTFVIKDAPVLVKKAIDLLAKGDIQMGQVEYFL
jgi:hypothetical protein